MSRRLIVRPQAEADITEAALWYENREAGLGLELTGEVRNAIGRAVQNPLLHLCSASAPKFAASSPAAFRIGFSSSCAKTPLLSCTPRVTTATGGNGYNPSQSSSLTLGDAR